MASAGLEMFSELTLPPSLSCTFAGALVPTFAAFGAVDMTVVLAGLFEVVFGGLLRRERVLSDGAAGFLDEVGTGVLCRRGGLFRRLGGLFGRLLGLLGRLGGLLGRFDVVAVDAGFDGVLTGLRLLTGLWLTLFERQSIGR